NMSDRAAGRGGPPQTREMQRNLIAARDEQITRVVAVVDALADRSAADALIAPLRPRLQQLRPPRPIRLARLLFLPLDPLIVPAPRWRPGDPLVPRTALTPLADLVRSTDGAVVTRVEASLAGGRRTAARLVRKRPEGDGVRTDRARRGGRAGKRGGRAAHGGGSAPRP